MRVKPIIITGLILTLIGWIAMMVSFWLPGIVGEALLSTALSIGIPGLVITIGPWIFWEEIEDYRPSKKARVLRCTDCASKILNPAGSTIGDQIEEEVMMLDSPIRSHPVKPAEWKPPPESPFDRKKR